jgi:hypothetical protein
MRSVLPAQTVNRSAQNGRRQLQRKTSFETFAVKIKQETVYNNLETNLSSSTLRQNNKKITRL